MAEQSCFYLSLVSSLRSVVRLVNYQEMKVCPAILCRLRQNPLCQILHGQDPALPGFGRASFWLLKARYLLRTSKVY